MSETKGIDVATKDTVDVILNMSFYSASLHAVSFFGCKEQILRGRRRYPKLDFSEGGSDRVTLEGAISVWDARREYNRQQAEVQLTFVPFARLKFAEFIPPGVDLVSIRNGDDVYVAPHISVGEIQFALCQQMLLASSQPLRKSVDLTKLQSLKCSEFNRQENTLT